MPVTLVLRKLRQEECLKRKARQSYMETLSQNWSSTEAASPEGRGLLALCWFLGQGDARLADMEGTS